MTALLKTLGGLELTNSTFQRPKPLLLLCYLTHQGPQERRHLAELFWPDASNGLASLSTALYRLSKAAPDTIGADEQRVWSHATTDAQQLQTQLHNPNTPWQPHLYQGPFLQGVYLPGWSTELEEWIYTTREHLAASVQQALLRDAETTAATGRFPQAAQQAAEALDLPGAPEPEPEHLSRYYALFTAAEHPYAPRTHQLANEYDLHLDLTPTQARNQLQRIFLGRDQELERLAALPPNHWAWVRGGPGIGKTTLLKNLPATYLPARAGLPYATLEPLLGEITTQGPEAILRRLTRQQGTLCIDDWEHADKESQQILTDLKKLRSSLTVVISSCESPPLPIDSLIELNPLPRELLEPHQELWETTGGVPRLVAAQLRGEPLAEALEAALSALPDTARRTYLALALLDKPDLTLVRRALELPAGELARALDALYAAGLATSLGSNGGRIWPRRLARNYLEARPLLQTDLALRLARKLRGIDAYPLYRSAHTGWTDDDMPRVRQAYLAWAEETFERGFAHQAETALADLPPGPDTSYLRALILEQEGFYPEALELVEATPETPDLLALKAGLLWRLGRTAEAEATALAALDGGTRARATALDALGEIYRSRGDFSAATSYYRRAAPLWRALKRHTRWVMGLNNVAVTLCQAGADTEEAEAAYQDAVTAAGDNPVLTTVLRMNIALEWIRQQRYDDAITAYQETIAIAQEMQLPQTECRGWNNLALVYEHQGRTEEAHRHYERALAVAQQTNETFMIGVTLANLAELDNDLDGLREALTILDDAGQHAIADRFRARLLPDELERLKLEREKKNKQAAAGVEPTAQL